MNYLDLFKKLPHLNDCKEVIKDWGYTPNLYHFDTKWHVSWMHCDDGSAFIDFEGETAEEAIQKAFDWCIELKLINMEAKQSRVTRNKEPLFKDFGFIWWVQFIIYLTGVCIVFGVLIVNIINSL